MGVQLLIRDGNPYWYLSPDIWVVPGNDPNGDPGSPVAGRNAYLWAHVANTGDVDARGVRIDFFWACPATQILRSTSTLLGSAFADVPAGGEQDVLCLVPWVPMMVNDGHECLIAVAVHPSDPLPDPPPDDFNPPQYRQVAQKNLTVLATSMMSTTLPVTISGWKRSEKTVVVSAEVGGKLDEITLARLGLKHLRPAPQEVLEIGLSREPKCVPEKEALGPKKVELRLPQGSSAAVHVAIRAKKLAKGHYQLVQVTERSGDKLLGGLAFVVIPDEKEKKL